MIEDKEMIMYRAKVDSPIGTILIAGDEEAITMLGRLEPHDDTDEWIRVGRFAHFKEAAQQLDAYWAGELFDFDLPLAARGTPFQQRVWKALRKIPYGRTATYGEVAREIGSPTASRAVGAANGRNPIAIVVPCHRVVGSNGTLTGYAGGLEMKRQLLDHERRYEAGRQGWLRMRQGGSGA